MDRAFYDNKAGELAQNGGPSIMRAKTQAAISGGATSSVKARLYSWTASNALGERSYEVDVYPHSGTNFADSIPSGSVVWVIRRHDAKQSNGKYGRWELLAGPPGGSGGMSTIPFRNDSGETAPAYAVMQVIDVATKSMTGSVNTSTDVWTLTHPVNWSTGQELQYTTTVTAPVTDPADLMNAGAVVWARMLSDTTMKLYTSKANALADTSPINFTTAGAGTHTFMDAVTGGCLLIKKPEVITDRFDDTLYHRLYVSNEGSNVSDGGTGRCRMLSCSYGHPVEVLVETSEYTGDEKPTTGQVLGPAQESWKLRKFRCGFTVLGGYNHEAGTVMVIQERERLYGHDYSQFLAANRTEEDDGVGGRDLLPYEVGVSDFGYTNAWGLNPAGYYLAPSTCSIFGVASADGIPGTKAGQMSLCYDRPAWALYDTDQGNPRIGDIYGIFPHQEDGKLRRGLPGFICLSFDVDNGLMFVIADHRYTVFEAKASGNWQDPSSDHCYVEAHPYDSWENRAYDGSVAGWPEITIKINLPRNGSGRDPNIKSGNRLQYSFVGSFGQDIAPQLYRYICVSPYLDDKIGTVKMYTGSLASIPQGWREHTGMRDRFPVGVLATTGIATSVGNTGGTKTHVHTGAAGLGSAGTSNSMNQASHIPPFYGVYFIERFE